MEEQIDRGNTYTYVGITDRHGQLIYLRWTNRDKGNQYTYDGRIGRQGQSITHAQRTGGTFLGS